MLYEKAIFRGSKTMAMYSINLTTYHMLYTFFTTCDLSTSYKIIQIKYYNFEFIGNVYPITLFVCVYFKK